MEFNIDWLKYQLPKLMDLFRLMYNKQLFLLGTCLVILFFNNINEPTVETHWQKAGFTWYSSYPSCCLGSPEYDNTTDVCEAMTVCQQASNFTLIGQKDFEWVKSHNLVSFSSENDPDESYIGRNIRLRFNGETYSALVVDKCPWSTCDGYCLADSIGGFLVSMEYWTVLRTVGTIEQVYGAIEWRMD